MSDPAGAQSAPDAGEEHLFRRLRPLLWAVAVRRMADPQLAGDLTQAALERTLLAVRERRIDDPERVGAYAIATLRNMVADESRTRARRERLVAQYLHAPAGETPTYALERDRLFTCFHRLEYRARLILAATFFEERTATDIADELGVQPGNLRVIRHRALLRMRACMEDPCP